MKVKSKLKYATVAVIMRLFINAPSFLASWLVKDKSTFSTRISEQYIKELASWFTSQSISQSMYGQDMISSISSMSITTSGSSCSSKSCPNQSYSRQISHFSSCKSFGSFCTTSSSLGDPGVVEILDHLHSPRA